tara:strand:- start:3627 stop:3974 length:348 start_codon:yes stop_codon:yes gene_type:complete
MNTGGMTKGKTKKFAMGGITMPDTSPPQSMFGNDGATGEVQKISASAQAAAKQLGQASSAIGGGGGSPYGGGGGSPYDELIRVMRPQPSPGMPYAKGGKVRGYGKARGGRACKMV